MMLQNGHFSIGQSREEGFSSEDSQRLLGQPDVLCLHEYLHVYRGKTAETPERRLMAAVLRDAVDCYIRDCWAPNRYKKRSYREAEEWFFKGDDRDVFSLDSVCGTLNVDPGYIRRMLLLHKEQNMPGASSGRMNSQREQSDIELPLAS